LEAAIGIEAMNKGFSQLGLITGDHSPLRVAADINCLEVVSTTPNNYLKPALLCKFPFRA
jgi:hypothetical protein